MFDNIRVSKKVILKASQFYTSHAVKPQYWATLELSALPQIPKIRAAYVFVQ